MDLALIAEGLIETVDGNGGLEVTMADSEKPEAGTVWIACADEKLAEQPLDCTRIMDGTVYKLVYTSLDIDRTIP